MSKNFNDPLYNSAINLKDLRNDKIEKFLLNELSEMYFTEKNLLKALPKMQLTARTPRLRKAFEVQFEFTKKQVFRLEQVFEKLKVVPVFIQKNKSYDNYSLTSYVGLAQLASRLGYHQVAALLEQSLQEENIADRLLLELAHADDVLVDDTQI